MKKLLISLSLILAISSYALAQGTFSYGIMTNVEHGTLHISQYETDILNIGFYQKGNVGYTLGAYAQYDFNSKLFVRGGVNYESSNYTYGYGGLIFPVSATSTGLIIEFARGRVEHDINISTVAIPLDFGLRIPTKSSNLNFLLGIGGAVNLSLNNNIKTAFYKEEGLSTTDPGFDHEISPSAYSISIFTGMEVDLGDRFIMAIEPTLKYASNSVGLTLNQAETVSMFEPGLSIRMRMR